MKSGSGVVSEQGAPEPPQLLRTKLLVMVELPGFVPDTKAQDSSWRSTMGRPNDSSTSWAMPKATSRFSRVS